MPADRLLGTLLRHLQQFSDQQDTPRILGTATSLLTTLNNPLNVVLLTSQLLSAPAIWTRPDLQTSMRCMSVVHSAAQALVRHEHAKQDKSPDRDFAALQLERTLPKDEWIRAVVKGADEHSPRWRHTLVLGGLLLGFGPREDENLSRSMRNTIEKSFRVAINLACEDIPEGDLLGQETITAVLNHCFPMLAHYEQSKLVYDRLLPVLMRAAFHAQDRLAPEYFLGAIDMDVYLNPQNRLQWPERSPSYQNVKIMLESPLIAGFGSLARLIGHCIEQTHDPALVAAVLDDLEGFTAGLQLQWRQNKLSTIDTPDESLVLDVETMFTTFPALWKLFRAIMFATVLILRSAIGKVLSNRALARHDTAHRTAAQTLRTLRSIYFISARAGSTTFSQHKFVHLAAIDILAAYRQEAQNFLHAIAPFELGKAPQHPLDRNADLFFLNTAEYLAPVVDPATAENLVMTAASPYLTSSQETNLLSIFEAAHSVMLATFCAPQNADITSTHLPFYVGALFDVFPKSLPVRQFRYAYLALLQITTPPSRLASKQPMLSSVLLELLRERAERASRTPLPAHILAPAPEAPNAATETTTDDVAPLSEQAVLVLTVIDTLTQLPLDLLHEWLPITGDMVNSVEDEFMREECKQHFWHTLVDGEMDPERSRVCHAWWSTAGGRETVLYGRQYHEHVPHEMSGALPEDSGKL